MPEMTTDPGSLAGMRAAVLVDNGVEDLEYWVTVMRLQEAGAEVTTVGTTLDEVAGKHGLKARADVLAGDIDATEVEALVVPGGWAPDKLRRSKEVTALVRAVHDAGKPIGIICHGGLVAISAGIVAAGSPVTGSLGIKDDLENAGGRWVDEPAFADGNLVWGRVVDDIPAFNRQLIALLTDHWAKRRQPASPGG